RRGRGPGRNRRPGVAVRSGGLLVDEGILFLLVMAPAARADGAAGAKIGGLGGGGGGVRRRGGEGARAGARGVLLARGQVLVALTQVEDQRPGEEQREDPPLERVGQMGTERRVRR